MKRLVYAALLTLAVVTVLLASGAPVQAQGCRYVLGFEAIHSQIPDIVGACVSNEAYDSRGNSLQQTANGLMEWRKADNFTAFTDGYRSWVNGPCGLEMRLNSQRFPWEANDEGLAGVSSRCQAAPVAQVPAAPAAPAATANETTETLTEGDAQVVVLRRLPPPPAQLTGEPSRRIDEATVQLVRITPDGFGIGTGTVVGGSGRTILTAFHVVGDLQTGQVYDPMILAIGPFMDYELRATVVATDPQNDLAVLRVQEAPGFGGFTVLPLADSDASQPGEASYVYSYPARREGGLGRSTGSLLLIGSRVSDGTRVSFATDALASPGSSGGMVVNSRGEVLGIITRGFRLTRGIDRPGLPTITQLTVATPINLAKPLLAQAGAQ